MLVCALCAFALSGCDRKQAEAGSPAQVANAPAVTQLPQEGSHGETDQSAALANMPTLAPAQPLSDDDDEYVDDDDDEYVDDDEDVASDEYYSVDALIGEAQAADAAAEATPTPAPQTASAVIDPNTMQFTALANSSMKMSFNYPSNWVNVPGVYTVCYREMAEPGEFPARVAISGKLLVHSPEGTVVTDELTAFVRVIRKQYDANTFQLGTLNTEDTFMGKPALSNTYLAYSGDTEVKGYIAGVAVGRVLYVFHFSASYDDYAALERVMRYMLSSAHIVQEET